MPKPDDQPRRRGGQPGNSNALKHGAYARAHLTPHTVELLDAVTADRGRLIDVVDILRVEMVRLVEEGDYKRMDLAALAQALIKASLADMKMSGGSAEDEAMHALDAVLADVRAAETQRDERHA